ncbi:MAG TPA: glycosyltransferase family 2 protein [Cyclobacteriaceae bacterium]|jgi:glycosyltransferase involved in cell wall biosynthesis
MNPITRVIIPAINEENSIAKVIAGIPKSLVSEVIVSDNGSSDNTPEIARQAGATVLIEPAKGYGNACLKAIEYVKSLEEKTDIIVFLDADFSDYPEEMTKIIVPIIEADLDLVIGSRALGAMQKGSMTFPQIFGNWLSTRLINLFFGIKFTDLGPFRAIKYDKLLQLDMQDKNFGWTVEMQVKAAKKKFRCVEVPVSYRKRIGASKISGTIMGTVLAGHKILWTIFKNLLD